MHRLLALFALLLLPSLATAQDATAIFEEYERRQDAVAAESAVLKMDIVDKRGRTRTREMQTWVRTSADGRTQSLVLFRAPADIRGTGLLTIESDAGDDQRLYLPSLRRVQRIAGNQRGERFAGSDFTYEDLGSRDPDRYDARLVSSDGDAWQIEVTPKGDEAYSRIVFHIEKTRYALRRADFYDADGDLWKRLTAEPFVELVPGTWRAETLTMEDVQADRRTVLTYLERDAGATLSDDLFTERRLKRGVR